MDFGNLLLLHTHT